MAITIEANYQKRLGLPNYSSHAYSVTVRTEVSDLSRIDRASSELYRQLQEAVDRDIRNTGFLPTDGNEETGNVPFRSNNGNGNGNHSGRMQGSGDEASWACSEKQKNLIERLIREHEISRDDLERLCQDRYRSSLRGLNKMQASGLIDELFETYSGKKAGSRKGGR